MTTSAIVVMVIGMLLIWGGLAAAITHAVRTARRQSDAPEARRGG